MIENDCYVSEMMRETVKIGKRIMACGPLKRKMIQSCEDNFVSG